MTLLVGSGGMFVQSIKFIESHNGNKNDISIYGQEYVRTTYKLAKMNLAIRGISADLGEMEADTFHNDQHKDLKADYIMANPPFNQKKWRAEDELIDDERWNGYTVPPTSNANYAWILNMVSKLGHNGVAGFLLANGSLTGDGAEFEIRKKLIENDLVEAIVVLPQNIFYTTNISVTLWILNRNKNERVTEENGTNYEYRNRENEILFMDLRNMGEPYEKKYIQLSDDEIVKAADIYHNWQTKGEKYKNIEGLCQSVTKQEVEKENYYLTPSKYIKFDTTVDTKNYEEEMRRIQEELKGLLKNDQENKRELLNLFKELGYEIKL